ncbi:Uncharacterized protein SCF082_LOCUS44250 [Durusdinium trenchii]|uniref:Uncharacterized protein n=1 Tax=Durusdinium trenchii TaxID=1381693 RepID=A0ABP0R2U3_9DINO
MDPKALRRDADRGQAAWDLKVQELADRGICLCQLLDFYALLGKSVMPGFHPARSTTNDVVRQAIIPLSAPSQRSEHGQAYACKVGERQPASRMVTHNWDNIFSHLVAAILADAFDVPSYGPFLMHLDEKLPALRDELAKVSYWICAFTVNQHSSICGGFGPAPQGDDFAAWDRKRYDSVTGEAYPLCGCATPKFFNKDWDLTELNKFDPMMECMSLRYSDMRQVIAVDERLDLFTRAWCIAEMHMAHKLQILQRVKLYDLDMLVDTPHFEHLDIQKCKASRKEDEDEILSKIEDKARFNHEVKTLLSDPVDGILVSPLWHKSRELAMRSIELSDMLNFFGSLSTMMPHYDARLSTTSDVVRGAIIPNSVAFPRYRRSLERSTAHNSCTPRWPAFAFSTVLKPWGAAPACCFVSQNWQMPFATVLARITANALQRSTFGGVLESLCEGGSVEVLVEVAKHEVGSCAYWLDAFCINQHTSICGGNPAGDRDSVTGELLDAMLLDIPLEGMVQSYDSSGPRWDFRTFDLSQLQCYHGFLVPGQWNRDSLEATLHRLPYGVEHFNECMVYYCAKASHPPGPASLWQRFLHRLLCKRPPPAEPERLHVPPSRRRQGSIRMMEWAAPPWLQEQRQRHGRY